MYDMSQPNAKPGQCGKCRGSGKYTWGGTNNGKPRHVGQCHSCRGTGKQTDSDIRRNNSYNRHKIANMVL